MTHELTTVIPPEPPLLLWPVLAVAQMLHRLQEAGEVDGVGERVPIPGARAGADASAGARMSVEEV